MSKEIYNGNTLQPKQANSNRPNRTVKPARKFSFSIVGIIIFISFIIVGYIWNKICVNKLVVEVNDLQNKYNKIDNENIFLLAEINKKSSLERIEKKISTDRLGLISPREQPIWFELDERKIEQFEKQ
jgi:hypothetical protein